MASGKKVLATDVWVERDGVPTVLAAGSTLPEWAKKLVPNPKAFKKVDEEADGADGNDSGKTPESTPPAPPASTYVAKRPNGDDVQPYAEWAFHDLQKEAGANGRGLEGGGAGTQEEIVARLTADDAAQAEQ